MSAQSYSYDSSFQDPFDYQNPTLGAAVGPHEDSWYGFGTNPPSNPNTLGNKISDFFGWTDYQGAYDRWTSNQDRAYERASIQSARAWDEYMQSTQYQRMVKDLEAAGLNPWLALQTASLSGYHQTTAITGGSAKQKTTKKESNKNTLANIASLIFSVAKLMAVL